jgi:death on curing protein
VEYIHDELLEVFWPSSENVATEGVRDRTLVESAVGRPFQSAFSQDIYPTIIEKGVALFHSLVGNHVFFDGNKRTAVTAFDHFLLANGFVLGAPNTEMYTLATKTASYRARNLSHEDSLEEIRSTIEYLITPISAFRL